MKFLSNMRIGQRQTAGFAVVTACLIAMPAQGKPVTQAGSAMPGAVASVQRMTDMGGEITDAGAEQSTGIGRVTHTIHPMDKSTQQNAALVEQATADLLRTQARVLEEVLGLFKLKVAR